MRHTIKYKDTFLTFYNYKEPLKKVVGGFGYEGVLLSTIDGKEVQCHICGELFSNVAKHTISVHKDITPTAHAYKEKFKLAFETALISEVERERRKEEGFRFWASMTPEQRRRHVELINRKAAAWLKKNPDYHKQPKIQLETKNKRGTCPDQLLEKIRVVAKKLGKTPSKTEFINHYDSQRFLHLIYATFGSWLKAVELAGLSKRPRVEHMGDKNRYSDDELLEFLTLFHQENGKIPSYTDARRKLLPDAAIYERRFGSFAKARELAGIHEKPGRWVKN